MKKKILSILLTLTMLLSLVPILGISSSAYELGTEENPIKLYSYADLKDLADAVSSGQNFDGKYFKLGDTFPTDDGAVTTPIGSITYPFKGNFDGNNKSVKVFINSTPTTDEYVGLFGYIDTAKSASRAVIKNVNIYGSISVIGQAKIYAGGLAGNVLGANFYNCSSTVFIIAKTSGKTAAVYCGGLFGGLNAVVTSPFEDQTEKSIVTNCHTEATIRSFTDNNASFGYTGNLCGTGSHTIFTDCYGRGITCASGYKLAIVGGIFGSTFSSRIYNCFSAGKAYVENTTNYGYAAGIAGYLQGKNPIADNCYSITELFLNNCNNPTKGGVIAYNKNSVGYEATITNCYSTNSPIVGDTDDYLQKKNLCVIDSDMKVDGVDLTKALSEHALDIKASTWGVVKGYNDEYPINKQVFNVTDETTDANVTVDVRPNASVGSSVKINTTLKNGYAIDTIKVYKTGDESTPVTLYGQNFIMPAYNVTVKVTLKQVVPITEKVIYQYKSDGTYSAKTVSYLNENNKEDSVYAYQYDGVKWGLMTKKEVTYDADGNITEEKLYVMNVETPYIKNKITYKYVEGLLTEQQTFVYKTDGTISSATKRECTYNNGKLVCIDYYSGDTLTSYDLYKNTDRTTIVTSYNAQDVPTTGRTYTEYDSSNRAVFKERQSTPDSKLDTVQTTIYNESGDSISEETYSAPFDNIFPDFGGGGFHCGYNTIFDSTGNKLIYNGYKYEAGYTEYAKSVYKYDQKYNIVCNDVYITNGKTLNLNNSIVNAYFADGLQKSSARKNSKGSTAALTVYNRYPEITDITSDDNGTITVETSACNDTEVTITPNPNTGCYLNSLEAYKTGDKDTIVPISENKFIMPEYDVTVVATFVRDLENVTIDEIQNQTYTGSEITPALTVKDGQKTLVKDTDYTVDYSDNINAGTASVAIYGIGTYCGSNITTFEIEPSSDLELSAESYLGMYDGEAHGLDASVNITEGTTIEYSYDEGENWTEEEPSYTDVCDYDIVVRATNPNYVTVEDNYSIEITKRAITITTPSDSKEYNGVALTNTNYEITGDGFVEGEGITVTVTGTQTDAGSSPNTFTYQFDEGTTPGNYEVTESKGTLTVDKSDDLTITVEGYEDLYDAQYHYGSVEANITAGTVIKYSKNNGETWSSAIPAFKSVGTHTVLVKAENPNYETVTDSYDVVISKRAITITSDSATMDYDSTALTKHSMTETGDGFLQGDGVEITYTGSQTIAGESDNTFTYQFTGNATSDIYDITTVYGKLTVNKSNALKLIDKKTSLVFGDRSYENTYNGTKFSSDTVMPNVSSENGTKLYYSFDNVNWTYSSNDTLFASSDKVCDRVVYVKAENDNYNTAYASISFKINPANISSATFLKMEKPTYTGEEIEPKFTVKVGNRTLKKDTDYTVECSNNINVGKATITITGIGNYTGTATTTFVINPSSALTVSASDYIGVYDGKEHSVTATVNYTDGTTVEYSTDKGNTWSNTPPAVTNAGRTTVTVKATNANYITATTKYKLVVAKRDISKAKISKIDKQVYSGILIKPDFTVKYGNTTLVKGVDYAVAYYNCVKPGTATVKIYGKGNYKGTLSAKFKIYNSGKFVDVVKSGYYFDAVSWATKNGITSGIDSTHYAPDTSLTRAQMITFLYRYAGSPDVKLTSKFKDVSKNAYYAKAVAWAYENGISYGTSATTFSPNEPLTRAEAVSFLWRMNGSPKTKTKVSFNDVKADAYYAQAVAWAIENGLTFGTTKTTFSPDAVCTRAQGISFIYRIATLK